MQIAIETNAKVNETGQITLDEPLKLAHNSRIRVIIITSEEEGEEPEDTPIEEIREGIYQGWQDMLAGRTKPVSQLWEGMDVD
jgi:putative sterol carrier protein